MLASAVAGVKPPRRCPFRRLPWPPDHPDWLALNAQLPPDHSARWFDALRDRLDLAPLRARYSGLGSPAHPPGQLLTSSLYLLSPGFLPPSPCFLPSPERHPS